MDSVQKAAHRIGHSASIVELEAEVVRSLELSPSDVVEKYQGEQTKLN